MTVSGKTKPFSGFIIFFTKSFLYIHITVLSVISTYSYIVTLEWSFTSSFHIESIQVTFDNHLELVTGGVTSEVQSVVHQGLDKE